MVISEWLKATFRTPVTCGPICEAIQHEVDSIGRAEALARVAKKQRNRQRGTRRT